MAMAVASLQQGDCDTAIVCGLNYLNEKDFHLSLQVHRHTTTSCPDTTHTFHLSLQARHAFCYNATSTGMAMHTPFVSSPPLLPSSLTPPSPSPLASRRAA